MKNFWNLKFHTKLILVYLLFVMGILILSSSAAYLYFKQYVIERAEAENKQIVVKMKETLENTIKEMEAIAVSLQEDWTIVEQMQLCDSDNLTGSNRLEYSYASKIALLDSVGPYRNLHRVSIYNDKGDMISTNSIIYDSQEIQQMVKESAEYYEIINKGKESVFIYDHYDKWMNAKYTKVLSYVKPLKNREKIIGFIEIQSGLNTLAEATSNDETIKMIVTQDNEVLFSNRAYYGEFAAAMYSSAIGEESNGMKTIINLITQKEQMLVFERTENDLIVLMALDMDQIMKAVDVVKRGIMITLLVISLVSICFIYIFSKRLTIPLRRLKAEIDAADSVEFVTTREEQEGREEKFKDEISLIEDSFFEMQVRLKKAMDREIQMRSVQNKVRFDALQARINPHFLYNTLGIIGGMCYEANQFEIGEMCSSLAQMFRYTTAKTDSPVTMQEEIEHAKDYLMLMKKRFEHRLEYTIETEEDLMGEKIPKLVIQPLIENSIIHGFQNQWIDVIKIRVTIKRREDHTTYIAIEDNGNGFDEKIRTQLLEAMQKYKRQVAEKEVLENVDGKGMGILNTYIRICFYFHGKADMFLENLKPAGAKVASYLPLSMEEPIS